MTFAKERNLERTAVVDERAMLRDALTLGMGALPFAAVRSEFEDRVEGDEFVEVDQRPGVPGRAFTTREMIALERDMIHVIQTGQHRALRLRASRHAMRSRTKLRV